MKFCKCLFAALFITAISTHTKAQGITVQPKKITSSQIYENLKKLNFLGTVLYVAAHPDDENTTAISYFGNTVKARTAYLSLTRGDGGQNIIGPELRELLGVIRTQELLAARATDGGEQRFTRANDFGYSKHPDETLAIWNKKEVLGDVVWTIRDLQPDIIINRFDHRSPGSTHGHHTSSAMLSVEAFDLAANPNAYPAQLKYTDTWQPKRQFFNTSWWFYGSQEAFAKADKSNLVKVDVGTYYPTLGLSNTEISSLSRSQHKSQGFGNTGSRGRSDTYFELLKGEMPQNQDIFEGIDTSWNRVEGGSSIGVQIEAIIANYRFEAPHQSIPALMKVYQEIQSITNTHWKAIKSQEIKDIISMCAGLYLEATTESPTATLGETVAINYELVNRSDSKIKLVGMRLLPSGGAITASGNLSNNEPTEGKTSLTIDKSYPLTSAYWLTEPGTLGMYKVKDQEHIGLPEIPQYNKMQFDLEIEGMPISFEKPLIYKYNDRVKGEVYQPFEIVPEASVTIAQEVIIFSDATSKQIPLTITAHRDGLSGSASMSAPAGWEITPRSIDVSLATKGQKETVYFTVIPPAQQSEGYLKPMMTVGSQNYDKSLVAIDYSHIPLQTLFLPAQSKIVRMNIERAGNYIGYIEGAGDAVPENLEAIGYQVARLKPEEITPERLAQFDAVMVGIRAYNVVDELIDKQDILLEYVKNGGTMITQYNTSGRWANTEVGAPFPLSLSRDRVTDENSPVSILAKDHPIITFPNTITLADFENWTQERGLYFPNEWSDEFTPILGMNDQGETSKEGALLVAKYGEGHYIYTGLSFFRELPAGVPGAYKLLVNMLSIGNQKTTRIKG